MSSLGLAMLDAARADLNVRETSPNSGPRVAEMLATVGLQPPQPWCAAAVTTWLRSAAKGLGVEPPVKGSALAQEIGRQLQRAGRWIDVAQIGDARRTLRPGMLLVWYRGPRESGLGHVGVIEEVVDGQHLKTIEGNSGALGDGVWRMSRSSSDPLLLGAGWVDDSVEPPFVEPPFVEPPAQASVAPTPPGGGAPALLLGVVLGLVVVQAWRHWRSL